MEDGRGEKGWRMEDGRWRMAGEKRDEGSRMEEEDGKGEKGWRIEDRRLRMES